MGEGEQLERADAGGRHRPPQRDGGAVMVKSPYEQDEEPKPIKVEIVIPPFIAIVLSSITAACIWICFAAAFYIVK
jgi:hypothetical protein